MATAKHDAQNIVTPNGMKANVRFHAPVYVTGRVYFNEGTVLHISNPKESDFVVLEGDMFLVSRNDKVRINGKDVWKKKQKELKL